MAAGSKRHLSMVTDLEKLPQNCCGNYSRSMTKKWQKRQKMKKKPSSSLLLHSHCIRVWSPPPSVTNMLPGSVSTKAGSKELMIPWWDSAQGWWLRKWLKESLLWPWRHLSWNARWWPWHLWVTIFHHNSCMYNSLLSNQRSLLLTTIFQTLRAPAWEAWPLYLSKAQQEVWWGKMHAFNHRKKYI